MKRPAYVTEVLLSPFSLLYAFLMFLRNRAYDFHVFGTYSVSKPVVSIGNLTAGGTGKTPITAFLAEGLQSRQIKVGIISRGYGGQTIAPEKVLRDGSRSTALRFGDEPTWLAAGQKDIPVFVGRDKVETAKALIEAEKDLQIIIADDAFQHRRLKRDIDLVIVDATEPKWHDWPLPLGRIREGYSSLSRAKVVIISKTNLAEPERLSEIRKRVAEAQSGNSFEVLEFISVISDFSPLILGQKMQTASRAMPITSTDKILLVSGIGRPETFSKLVSDACHAQILAHRIFQDHHIYSEADQNEIEKQAVSLGADAIVMTEKDAVKLTQWKPRIPCFVSRLTVKPSSGNMESVYEAIRRLSI